MAIKFKYKVKATEHAEHPGQPQLSTRLDALMALHKLSEWDMALLLKISKTSVHRYRHGTVPTGKQWSVVDTQLAFLETRTDIPKPTANSIRAKYVAPDRTQRDKFIHARNFSSLSQDDAAKILGCSQNDVSRFERGIGTWLKDKDIDAFIEVYSKPAVKHEGVDLKSEVTGIVHDLANIKLMDADKCVRLVLQFLEFGLSEGFDFNEVVRAFNE